MMQLSGINKNFIYYKNNYYFSNSKKAKSNFDNSIEQKDLNFKDASIINKNVAKVSFLGYNVFITDGGNHADNMLHFAKAISSDIEPILEKVKILPNDPNVKFLKDLEHVLKEPFKKQFIWPICCNTRCSLCAYFEFARSGK